MEYNNTSNRPVFEETVFLQVTGRLLEEKNHHMIGKAVGFRSEYSPNHEPTIKVIGNQYHDP